MIKRQILQQPLSDATELNAARIPFPPSGSDEEFVRSIIEMVLNYSLNRHAYKPQEGGFLKSNMYSKENGWNSSMPQKTLQLKFDLMDEAVEILQTQIVEKLQL